MMTAEQRFKERLANALRARDLQLMHALEALSAAEVRAEQAEARVGELEQQLAAKTRKTTRT